ncbi:hypothetical protein Zm00014a_040019 [Zea mays]|uniref:Uncharacterized protein n=1 Tax=Zea mays TaxID=4577 RepID=A0A3L6DU42_MAIZE|nr:hypothetical protein Zm00014a_040019 [Zea mays]
MSSSYQGSSCPPPPSPLLCISVSAQCRTSGWLLAYCSTPKPLLGSQVQISNKSQ